MTNVYIFKYLYSVLDMIEEFSLGGVRSNSWEQPESVPNKTEYVQKKIIWNVKTQNH